MIKYKNFVDPVRLNIQKFQKKVSQMKSKEETENSNQSVDIFLMNIDHYCETFSNREITENEEIKCEPNVITSFSYKIEYNTLYLDIVGDFDFKLEIKPSDYVTNEEDEMSAQLQVDLTNRTIVYIESEVNPDFKDYVDNLGHGNGSFEEFKQIEDRLKILENKTSNIESSITPEISTELSIENLLKSYDERIKVLENKCANIQ